jgi:hypothetical protein
MTAGANKRGRVTQEREAIDGWPHATRSAVLIDVPRLFSDLA